MGAEQRAAGNLEQAAALEDGAVTREEYEAAFADLGACLSRHGYSIGASWTSPIDGNTILFRMDGDGLSETNKEQVVGSCIGSYWDPVSAVYQDTAEFAMDENLRLAAIACLRELGYELTGDERTPAEMSGPDAVTDNGLSRRWEDTVACLRASQHDLFPEIETFAITHR